MSVSTGIGLAVIAMLSWGIGDFLVQKSAKRLGGWETLFVITAFGTIILLPFVYKDIPALLNENISGIITLLCSAVFLLTAAMLQISSLKTGKISVLEPMLSLELIAASFLSFIVLGDVISAKQITTIVVLIIGLFLVSFRGKFFSTNYFIEKGVFVFALGAFLMGGADFFLGWGTRVTDPLMANFVLNITIATTTFIALMSQRRVGELVRDIRRNPALVLAMSITDNIAWIAYAFAMSLIPIAVATGLSESSIIVAVLLGIFMNKERLQRHQKVGVVIALLSAIVLAVISS